MASLHGGCPGSHPQGHCVQVTNPRHREAVLGLEDGSGREHCLSLGIHLNHQLSLGGGGGSQWWAQTHIPSVASAEGSNRRREGPSPSKVLSGCLRPTQRRQVRRRETLNSRGWDGLGLGTGHRVLRKPAVRGPRCPTPCVPNHPEDEAYALEVSDPGPQWAGLSQSNPVGSQHWRMQCGGHVTFNCSPRSRSSRDAGPAQSSLQAQTGLPSSPSVYSPGTSRLVHPEAPLTDGSRELGRGGGGRVMTHT